MRKLVVLAMLVPACGSPAGGDPREPGAPDATSTPGDGGGGVSDPGKGSKTIAATATFTFTHDAKNSRSAFLVQLDDWPRDTIPVASFRVTAITPRGTVELAVMDANEPKPLFQGVQPGGGGSYRLEISAGPNDWLDATIAMPDEPVLVSPDPSKILDAHSAAMFDIVWRGAPAERFEGKVRNGNFQWEGADTGTQQVRANVFRETEHTIELRRLAQIELAGASHGTLVGRSETGTDVLIANPW